MTKILILDFGSQYSQLILRKLRELGYYADLKNFNTTISEIEKINPNGIILSGGPHSVYENNAPLIDPIIFTKGIPILGICYGLQLMTYLLGGKVEKSEKREFGKTQLTIEKPNLLFESIPIKSVVWMSHSDAVVSLPSGFESIASSDNTFYSAVQNSDLSLYGLQFHPEVNHTKHGKKILENFAKDICKCKKEWILKDFIKNNIEEIKQIAGNKKVFCALSGGVDSTVAAVLAERAIGSNLICLHIDNGLMRKNESKNVLKIFKEYGHLNVHFIDASERFLNNLKNIQNPEEKRKIIGNTFIKVFEDYISQIGDVEYLIQGTLFPDLIESSSHIGPSSVIKTHHNVGGLPEKMKLKLIEPLKELFKDEVRKVGEELGIPNEFLARHPFPGPGLAVRILGEVTSEKLNILRECDDIFISELRKNNLYNSTWQAFCVLLPVKSVGVMGDNRTYEYVIALRAVDSKDGMTADCMDYPPDFLKNVSNRIVNEIKGVNRVVYDITSKPPATIEWE